MRRPRRSPARIEIVVDDPAWRKHRAISLSIRRAAELALQRAPASVPAALTILLASDSQVRDLNCTYRGKDKPTNVLSFPFPQAGHADYLGDIVLAYGVVRQEAAESRKRFVNHAAHLAVHGVLHLLGYDHVKPRDAAKMEAVEVAILGEMGIGNPYEMRSGD